MDKLIKVYGERNTNTNYISKLINLNLNAIELSGTAPRFIQKCQKYSPGNELIKDCYFWLTYKRNLGWKHACVKSPEELSRLKHFQGNTTFVTITKNPYSWLLSLYRSPYHQYYTQKPNFEEFLQLPWKTLNRENISAPAVTPIELWNNKNSSYLQLPTANTINITTEDIFKDPANIIQKISETGRIERLSKSFCDYQRSTKDRSKDNAYYKNYYLSEQWKENLSQTAINIINRTIDQKTMTAFGYTILPSA